VLIAVAGARTGYRIAGRGISRETLTAGAVAVAACLVAFRRCWRWARVGITAVHESGHAVAALLVGRKVTAIRLRRDTSGVTVHYGPAGRSRRLVTSAAGYPAPGTMGVTGAWLLEQRHLRLWLLALLLFGVVNLVLWVRNPFGVLVMGGWVGGLVWLIARGTAGVEALVSAVAVWFLVLGGLRSASESEWWRRGIRRRGRSSDAADIEKLIHVPSPVCQAAFVLLSGAAVLAAGVLTVRTH
jgi:hypothetical protein